MRHVIAIVVILAWSLSAIAAWAGPPTGSLYIDGGQNPVGIVLVPGRGQNADGYVAGPMRKTLNRAAGYHTISIQLPATTQIENVTPELQLAEMKSIYPSASATIKAAADFLRQERGVKHVYLVAHSMGSTIVATMLTQSGPNGFVGVVLISTGDYGEAPFNTTSNAGRLPIPALDVFGDPTGISHPLDAKLATADVSLAASRAQYVSAKYKQVRLTGAGHAFVGSGNESALTQAITSWISEQEAANR